MSWQPQDSFGGLLRRYREQAGLTQEALAEKAGLTPNAISSLERGRRRNPYPHTVQALAAALRLPKEQHDLLIRLAREKKPAALAEAPLNVPSMAEGLSSARLRQPRLGALPVVSNRLIGREAEFAAVRQGLIDPAQRLLTLTGPGGVGKTRLAVAVAAELAPRFAGGVAWVPLALVSASDQVAVAIAEALGERLHGIEPPAGQVLAALRDQEVLLVLDNMEHALDAGPWLVALLAAAPAVRCLITSRERLRVSGEWVIDLQGLPFAEGATLEESGQTAAVLLFAERARQVERSFVVNGANLAAIHRLCRLLEGIPLAIELAAAWITALSPAEIAAEVAHNLDFLARAARDAPPRHSSLRAVFDASWHLLSLDEQRAFTALAVFQGGFTRSAAEAVAGASSPLLAALVDKSLLRRAADAAGASRFDLHEMLRQYALDKLRADPETEAGARDRHCTYYARQLSEREAALPGGAMFAAWTEVAADVENVRAAWAWAVHRCDYQAFVQMGQSLYVICEVRGLFEEGLALFLKAAEAIRAGLGSGLTAQPVQTSEPVWALGQVLSQAGRCAAGGGRFGQARDLLREGYELLQQRGDVLVNTGTLVGLGYTAFVQGAYAEARTWFTDSIGLSRAHGATFFVALSQSMLALVAQAQGAEDALELAQVALEEARGLGHPRLLTTGLWVLSHVLMEQGALDRAEQAVREGLQVAAGAQDAWSTATVLLQLGWISLARGDAAMALAPVEESVRLLTDLGEPWSRGRALLARGWVAEGEGHAHEAQMWFQQALNLARSLQLDPLLLNAQYGLAWLMRAEAPAAAAAVLEQIIGHPAAEHATLGRARRLRQALEA
jgi:predicted ATPase/transcriptional regulator with XRE-family HTH domain